MLVRVREGLLSVRFFMLSFLAIDSFSVWRMLEKGF